MRNDADLKRATRKTLLAIIAEQQAVIIELQRRIDELERRVPPRGRPVGMPGNKPVSKRPRPGRTEPRKKRTHGFARRRMNPTRQVVHALDSCPECRTDMTGGWVHRTREIIEIPLVPDRGDRAGLRSPHVRPMPQAAFASGLVEGDGSGASALRNQSDDPERYRAGLGRILPVHQLRAGHRRNHRVRMVPLPLLVACGAAFESGEW